MFPVSFLIGTITLTCVGFGLFVLAWAHCRKQGFFGGYDPFSLKPFFIVLTFIGIWLAPSILFYSLWLGGAVMRNPATTKPGAMGLHPTPTSVGRNPIAPHGAIAPRHCHA